MNESVCRHTYTHTYMYICMYHTYSRCTYMFSQCIHLRASNCLLESFCQATNNNQQAFPCLLRASINSEFRPMKLPMKGHVCLNPPRQEATSKTKQSKYRVLGTWREKHSVRDTAKGRGCHQLRPSTWMSDQLFSFFLFNGPQIGICVFVY